ncbi:hypothetical protein AMECASPLE_016610 [Ameca splendens]|uniref:Uncharacterized protein n=1 Tax=Ameca splendens TaxID=208324 RepID=A0ABV0ZZ03_9TELE
MMPSIHPSAFNTRYRVTGELVPISSSLWVRGNVHPGQVASQSQGNTETHRTKNPCTHTSTPKGYLGRPINLTVMFSNCGRVRENLDGTHSMQKDPGRVGDQDLLAA